jgi:hypothetical protein
MDYNGRQYWSVNVLKGNNMGWIVLGFVQLWKFSMHITIYNDATLCAYWFFYEITNWSSIINHWSKLFVLTPPLKIEQILTTQWKKLLVAKTIYWYEMINKNKKHGTKSLNTKTTTKIHNGNYMFDFLESKNHPLQLLWNP